MDDLVVKDTVSKAARVRALSRHHGPDAEVTREARRDLVAANARDYLQKVVDSFPPPTPDQLDELRLILDATGLENAGEQ